MTAELPNDVVALQAEVAELRTTVARLSAWFDDVPGSEPAHSEQAAAIS